MQGQQKLVLLYFPGLSPRSRVATVFLSITVAFLRYIDECEVYFLLVGHTHGQIDQMFSVLARFLKFHPAKTLPELAWALWYNFFNPDKGKLGRFAFLIYVSQKNPFETQTKGVFKKSSIEGYTTQVFSTG